MRPVTDPFFDALPLHLAGIQMSRTEDFSGSLPAAIDALARPQLYEAALWIVQVAYDLNDNDAALTLTGTLQESADGTNWTDVENLGTILNVAGAAGLSGATKVFRSRLSSRARHSRIMATANWTHGSGEDSDAFLGISALLGGRH